MDIIITDPRDSMLVINDKVIDKTPMTLRHRSNEERNL